MNGEMGLGFTLAASVWSWWKQPTLLRATWRSQDQKSMQRPFFSQSPNRVGSGPLVPPISCNATDARPAGGEEEEGSPATRSVYPSLPPPADCDSFCGLFW